MSETYFDFIKSKMFTLNSVDEIISQYRTDSTKGYAFERLWNILIKLGFCEKFNRQEYDHYTGNIDKNIVKINRNYETFFKKTSGKGPGGPSDITLFKKHNKEWVFISCKYHLNKTKSTDKFDIEKISLAATHNKTKYNKYIIYIFVKDKNKVEKKFIDSYTKYIKETIYNSNTKQYNILDVNDLEYCFQNFKHKTKNMSWEQINKNFIRRDDDRDILSLRFHQELIVHNTMEKIKNKLCKNILWAMKARSGKTYCVGGLFDSYLKEHKKLNALIITPAPKETLTQFSKELFDRYLEFIKMNIIELKGKKDIDNINKDIEDGKNNIIIVSKQLLDDYVDKQHKTINKIKNLHLDFIVFDENHFHGTTEKTKDIFSSYSLPDTIMLYLTATYFKPLNEWDIKSFCQFYWDIEDEKLCKKRDIGELVKKHGSNVYLFLNDKNQERKLGYYDNMPELYLMTNFVNPNLIEKIKHDIEGTDYGFSNSTLFSLNIPEGEKLDSRKKVEKCKPGFKFLDAVDSLLEYISGQPIGRTNTIPPPSIFDKIRTISDQHGSRTLTGFTTQLWFLPYGPNLPIDHISLCLKERMEQNQVLNKYQIYIANSKHNIKNIKNDIKEEEENAKRKGKKGLIILLGSQLSLGVTLPYADIVFLLNDLKQSDKIIQMMYRCMTEKLVRDESDLEINDGDKKMGFVVDLNLSRVLQIILDYHVKNDNLSIKNKIKYVIENNLIYLEDAFFKNKENKSKLIERLTEVWKTNPMNSMNNLLNKINTYIVNVNKSDQDWLNRHFSSSVKDTKTIAKIKMDTSSSINELPTGRKIIKRKTDKKDEKTSHIEKEISISNDILPFVLPLSSILTLKDINSDFIEVLQKIKDEPKLFEIFINQMGVWYKVWNGKEPDEKRKEQLRKWMKDMIRVFSDIDRKGEWNVNNIMLQFKSSFHDLIDQPDKALEFINSCLKRHGNERDQLGEVFTPIPIIEEMFDNLDKYYKSIHSGKSIFSDKNLTWFDPASGMGNFPIALYLRLMKGLENNIPDKKKRKKHILEKMIYMSEFNKKNVFICKQLFDIGNTYKLNLYNGDTLKLNPKEEWGIDKFDVIMGNPPYNQGGVKSTKGDRTTDEYKSLWIEFTSFSLNHLQSHGYLLFITPLYWLKNKDIIHTLLLSKYIVWLQLCNNVESQRKIGGKIPTSIYILHNIDNIHKRKTYINGDMVYLDPNDNIPLAYFSIFKKLQNFIKRYNLHLEFNRKTIHSTGVSVVLPRKYKKEDHCHL